MPINTLSEKYFSPFPFGPLRTWGKLGERNKLSWLYPQCPVVLKLCQEMAVVTNDKIRLLGRVSFLLSCGHFLHLI